MYLALTLSGPSFTRGQLPAGLPPLIPSACIESEEISEDMARGHDIVSTRPGNTVPRFMAYHAATGVILVRSKRAADFKAVQNFVESTWNWPIAIFDYLEVKKINAPWHAKIDITLQVVSKLLASTQ